jgi:hypothetical protein
MAQAPKRTKRDPSDLAEASDPRRGRSAAIAADAGTLAAGAFARRGFTDPTLVLRWRDIVGAQVADIAIPVRLSESPSGATLTLKAEPGAALFLQHESRQLCARINAWAGCHLISRLRFVQGQLEERPDSPSARNPSPPPPTDPARRFIGQKELKAALLALAGWRRAD